MDRRHYSAPRNARCVNPFVGICVAAKVERTVSHWGYPGLVRHSDFAICTMSVVLVEKHSSQITVLTLNRPERRNALTLELVTELSAAIKAASEDPETRVIILRGAGPAFCTGPDLKEAADQTNAHAIADMVAHTLITVSETHLVTIA